MIYKRNKHYGFTILELLLTIVIIGIIALIAIPSVLNLMDDSKKESLKVTAKSLTDGAKGYVMTIADGTAKTFTIENGEFVGEEIPVSGALPTSGTIMVNENLQVAIAVVNGKWCARKKYSDTQVSVNNNISDCNLESLDTTTSSCFNFDTETGSIIDYYEYENNEETSPACPKELVIPSTMSGVSVTAIGEAAFFNKQLTSVTFPNTLVTIGLAAFDSNILTNITIPNSVTSIGGWAFLSNQLTSITIPDSVTNIGSYAFQANQLESVTLPDNIVTIDNGSFCNNYISSITIPNTVTTIEYAAFFSNNLTSLVIPNSVTTIGNGAFYSNSIESLTIPSSVTTIGEYAFNYNQLSDGDAFIYKRNSDGSVDNTVLISYGGSRRSNVVIPSNVVTIGANAFYSNSLTSVTIPSSVTTIEQRAFVVNQITNITIPSSVTSIGQDAFYQSSYYPWGTVTIKYNGTNPANRFDSSLSSIGWDSATMSYVSD